MWNDTCAVINCSNSTYKLKKWKQEICSEYKDFNSSCKREEFIHCTLKLKLYCFPSILKNAELRNKWIRALKRQNKDKTEWKIIKTDAKMRCHTGIASVILFNTIFTLTKPYISHATYWKGPKHAMRILKKTLRKKMTTSLNHHDEFLLTLIRLRLRMLHEDPADHFDISPTKSLFIFYNLDEIIEQDVKKISCLATSRSNSR